MSAHSPFDALLDAGRLREAALAVRDAARGGLASWEARLWLGRLEERRARPGAAERAYRRAVADGGGGLLPVIELARLLERQRRTADGEAALRPAAERAARDFADSRPAREAAYLALEYEPFRRAFLAALARRGRAARAEAAARADGELPEALTLRADLLAARGRTGQAASALVAALAAGRGADGSAFAAAARLSARGAYPVRLEESLRARVRGCAPADKAAREWPALFSALMCARRYRAAFALAEAALDALGCPVEPSALLWPWWPERRRAVAEEQFLREELESLLRDERRGSTIWHSYFRAVLLSFMGRYESVVAAFREVPFETRPRYAWMGQPLILAELDLLDFPGAARAARAILARAPDYWWVRCRLAEALLASGDEEGASRELDAALAGATGESRAEVLTWRGEVLLWMGRYREALKSLDEALALGRTAFTRGWRGATLLMLGREREALEELDRAVAEDPKDFEALGWRGELHRRAGRRGPARRDLDAAIARAPGAFWARVNRALLRGDAGDGGGLLQDYRLLPADVREAIGGPTPGFGGAAARASARKALESALSRARGVRRWETYTREIWRRRP